MDRKNTNKRKRESSETSVLKLKKDKIPANPLNNTAYPFSTGPRKYTVSVALPGSIIANAQGLELKTFLAGQVSIYMNLLRCLKVEDC